MSVLKLAVVAMLAWVTAIGCGVSKLSAVAERKPKNPDGETWESPCQEVYDTPEEFAITASSRGSSNEREKVQKSALATAQALIRPKMQHAYKSLLSGYSTSLIHKKDYDIERKMDSAGIRVIDRIINETSASCVGWGEIEDDGQITCYTAIRIPKGDVAAEITKEVADKLTREEKDLFGFNEQKFRKEMKKHFEEYKRNAE